MSRCDFCGTTGTARVFPCRDCITGSVDGQTLESIGDWHACSICGSLIDAQEWTLLEHRAWDIYTSEHERPSELIPVYKALIHSSHTAFRRNRL